MRPGLLSWTDREWPQGHVLDWTIHKLLERTDPESHDPALVGEWVTCPACSLQWDISDTDWEDQA